MTTRFIYFIDAKERHQSPIKIGLTGNIEQRVSALQAFTPDELQMLGYVEGTYKDEALIHRAFSAQHIRSEWFRYSPELSSVVSRIVLHGFESVRSHLNELAKSGVGIRIKSPEGIETIRRGTSGKRVWPETADKVRIFMREHRRKSVPAA
jgi:hypothetical protein